MFMSFSDTSGTPAMILPVEQDVMAPPLLVPPSVPPSVVPDDEPPDELEDDELDDDEPEPEDELAPEEEEAPEELLLPPASLLSELLELEQPPMAITAHGARRTREGRIVVIFMKDTPQIGGAKSPRLTTITIARRTEEEKSSHLARQMFSPGRRNCLTCITCQVSVSCTHEAAA